MAPASHRHVAIIGLRFGADSMPDGRLGVVFNSYGIGANGGEGFEPSNACALPIFKVWKAGDAMQPGAILCKNCADFPAARSARRCIQLQQYWEGNG